MEGVYWRMAMFEFVPGSGKQTKLRREWTLVDEGGEPRIKRIDIRKVLPGEVM